MRACVQRVARALVRVDGQIVGEIGPGLVVLLGVAADDGPHDAAWLAEKLVSLRVFDDDQGRMNLSLAQTGGAMLVISQFTLLADCRKGRRPTFVAAAPAEAARRRYDEFVAAVDEAGIRVATGRFGAHMHLELVNDGPVTVIVDGPDRA